MNKVWSYEDMLSTWVDLQKKTRGNKKERVGFNLITKEKLKEILGEMWYEILFFNEIHNVPVRNIVVIGAKSTMKTKATLIFAIWDMLRHPWVSWVYFRDTQKNAWEQGKMHCVDTLNLVAREYKLFELLKKNYFTYTNLYLELNRFFQAKDNQKIVFTGIDDMVKSGGFTSTTGFDMKFFWEEPTNPSKVKAQDLASMTQEQFKMEYLLANAKNDEMFKDIKLVHSNPTMPRNFFMMNRWDSEAPLTVFCETHLPWDTTEEMEARGDMGVRDWMLQDPFNNTYAYKYVGAKQAEKGWEFLDQTLIVYLSQASNHLKRKDPDFQEFLLQAIENGDQADLAMVLGDLHDGWVQGLAAYHYSRREKITQQDFLDLFVSKTEQIALGVDIDFTRQIVITPTFLIGLNVSTQKIYHVVVGEPIIINCKGADKDGIKSEAYFARFVGELSKLRKRYIELFPWIKRIYIWIDESRALWTGRINYGDAMFPDNYFVAQKVNARQKWDLEKRPKDMSKFQETGFIIDIESKYFLKIHQWQIGAKKNINTGKRIEREKDKMVDLINSREWAIWPFIIYFNWTQVAKSELARQGINYE